MLNGAVVVGASERGLTGLLMMCAGNTAGRGTIVSSSQSDLLIAVLCYHGDAQHSLPCLLLHNSGMDGGSSTSRRAVRASVTI